MLQESKIYNLVVGSMLACVRLAEEVCRELKENDIFVVQGKVGSSKSNSHLRYDQSVDPKGTVMVDMLFTTRGFLNLWDYSKYLSIKKVTI